MYSLLSDCHIHANVAWDYAHSKSVLNRARRCAIGYVINTAFFIRLLHDSDTGLYVYNLLLETLQTVVYKILRSTISHINKLNKLFIMNNGLTPSSSLQSKHFILDRNIQEPWFNTVYRAYKNYPMYTVLSPSDHVKVMSPWYIFWIS